MMEIKQLTRINIIITLVVLIGNIFYQGLGFSYPLKIVCSSGFAITGIINYAYATRKIEEKRILSFMALGLIFAFLGDVAINPNFILGVIFFALGHVFFVDSYLIYKPLHKWDILLCLGLGVFSISFILCFPYILFEVSVLKYVVLVYACIISVMVGKSVGNAICEKSIFTCMIMLGSILFFISDMMLLLAWFSKIEGRWTSHVCMATYYPALCLLAGSMVLYVKTNVKKDADSENIFARVMQMEKYYDEVQDTLNKDDTNINGKKKIVEMVQSLREYQVSGQWLKDYENDEKGKLPSELKRGVLSEDGLYNLLNEVEKRLST